MESTTNNLNAKNLSDVLWETLTAVKDGDIVPAQADSVATQAREILRTKKLQLQIARESQRTIPVDVIAFSENQ